MKSILQRIILLGSALGLAFVVGCADKGSSPLAPSAESQSLTSTLTTVNVLQRLKPLAREVSVSADIGKDGGSIVVPGTGLQVIFPKNAISPPANHNSVRITVTAVKGFSVAYKFEPHGIKFLQPVTVRQDASGTAAIHDLRLTRSRGAYFPDDSLLGSLTAQVSEFRHTTYESSSAQFVFTIEHFSGYLLASD